ncbi:hypothetical protein GLU64_00375 [Nanohaloarchaea archaeon]|nr:hypothetical protein [Candidatus Nanohaloarchaea archaeon]
MDIVKSSILKASAATILVLVIGLLLGLQVDDMRGNYIQDQLRESDLEMQNFLVTQNYLDDSTSNYCGLVETRIPELSRQNTEIGSNLQSFSGKSLSNGQEYKFLVRKYYVNQLRLYNLLSDYNERCKKNTTLIFYFFDDSVQSQRQGAVLTEYYREVDNSSYIFSFNLEKEDSSVLNMLREGYNVTDGPAVVLNGDRTYRRYVPLKELEILTKNESLGLNSSQDLNLSEGEVN